MNIQKGISMSYGHIQYDPIKDAYMCEICHKWFAGLGYHIAQTHNMTADEYKVKFGLEKNKCLCVKRISNKLSESNKKHKAYKNLTKAGWLKNTKGRVTIQKYKRSAETINRIKTLYKKRKKRKAKKHDHTNKQ